MTPRNLLDLKPRRNLEWEVREEGLVTLLVPKFRNPLLVRWLVPMLAKPVIRVNLDERGSYVWQCFDGATSVSEIGKRMGAKFGEPLDSTYDRIGKFLQQLSRDKFVVLSPESATSE